MKIDTVKIDTVPLPERPASIEIPVRFLREFEKDARIVIRHPYIVGIPVPMFLLKKLQKDPAAFRRLTDEFEIMLIPK